MSKADAYNRKELEAGRITYEHLDALFVFAGAVREYQDGHGLTPDGMLGPKTRALLVPEDPTRPLVDLSPLVIHDHWGEDVTHIPIHSSWYYAHEVMKPTGVVCHYSVTEPGSAKNMARRRQGPRGGGKQTSWHATIEPDGEIVQMVPFNRGAWHARPTSAGLKLLGNTPNRCTIGIELVSVDGSYFPPPQVAAYARLLRALVRTYRIPRKFAMIPHSSIHPTHQDPGPVWMRDHADRVVQYAYTDSSF